MSDKDRLSMAALTPGRLAWLLESFRDPLIAAWKMRVLEDGAVPDANRLTTPALEDHIPDLLTRIIQRLARHPKEAWGEQAGREVGGSEVGVAHARQRMAVHYTLAEALRELSHFRAAVLELCTEHDVVPHAEEASLLHATIDEMMATSATELERSSRHLYEQAMGVVAHDLRNPLNTIAGYAARIPKGGVDLVKAGEVLTRSARTMERLVEDLLQHAKLAAGHFSIHPADVDAASLVHETSEQFAAAARRRNVDLSTKTPSDPIHIVCDADRILQALGNLVGNAIKFTPPGGRVTLGLEALEDRCVFRVTDTGPGVAPAHADDVFRAFWQAPGSAQGAGLGLAITRSIVEAHGGSIGIESHAPPGATFVLTLPFDCTRKESASFAGPEGQG